MTRRETAGLLAVAVGFVLLAFVPALDNAYLTTLAISVAMYGVLATSWALFSGPTHYISLATAAFYGLGAYTVASGIETLPYALLVRHRRARRRRAGAARRRGDAAAVGRVLRHLHARAGRIHPPGRDLGAEQLHRQPRDVRADRPERPPHLLAAAGAGGAGRARRLARQALAAGLRAAHHRQRRTGGGHSGIHSARAKVTLFVSPASSPPSSAR
jgi:ABC-type branched-subunit amino acid transport system permease subunit